MNTAAITAPESLNTPSKSNQEIPDYLVREVVNGVNFYYPGFREVLNNSQNADDIMPDSILQSTLKNEVGDFLKACLGKQLYRVLSGETGLHISHRNNLGLDIAVYDKSILTRDKVTDSYANVPAELVIEIDLSVEMEDKKKDLFTNYVLPKTQQLIDFGTKRVVWLLIQDKKIMVAEPGEKWFIQNLAEPVELMPGAVLDLPKLMEDADITLSDFIPGGS